ncbi:hypothetical protein GR11A_00214 [Vibrio phage vB_VcorM_GR11A]|nr:hypothetical protein GR11A_00214 [Vibrio phage vB_VcorM_GR11A]
MNNVQTLLIASYTSAMLEASRNQLDAGMVPIMDTQSKFAKSQVGGCALLLTPPALYEYYNKNGRYLTFYIAGTVDAEVMDGEDIQVKWELRVTGKRDGESQIVPKYLGDEYAGILDRIVADFPQYVKDASARSHDVDAIIIETEAPYLLPTLMSEINRVINDIEYK